MNENKPIPKDMSSQKSRDKRNLHYDPESSFTNDGCTAVTEGTMPWIEKEKGFDNEN